MLVQPGSKLSPGITCKSNGFVGAPLGVLRWEQRLDANSWRQLEAGRCPPVKCLREAGWEPLSPEG